MRKNNKSSDSNKNKKTSLIILGCITIIFSIFLILITTGVYMPFATITTRSMEHRADFESWWSGASQGGSNLFSSRGEYYESIGITKKDFKGFRFKNGISPGDLILIMPFKNINVGDVISFWEYSEQTGKKGITTHRVIKVIKKNNTAYYQTKGDNYLPSRDEKTGEVYGMHDTHYLPYMSQQYNNTLLPRQEVIGEVFARVQR